MNTNNSNGLEACQKITDIIRDHLSLIETTWILRKDMREEIEGSIDLIIKSANGLREVLNLE